MKRLALAVVVCGVTFPAWAQQTGQAGSEAEMICGQELKENAKYPMQLKSTVSAVADMHEAHARWVGNQTREAKAESEALRKMVKQLREIEKQSDTLASTMQASAKLPQAEHDMSNVPPELLSSMERVRDEYRRLGNMLINGAQEMDQRLSRMRGVGGAGGEGMQQPVDPSTSEPMSPQPPSSPPMPNQMPPQQQ